MQHLLIDEQSLDRVASGFERICRALTPRLERYKVELFIHLCEGLESDEDQGEMESSEEDVYGSGKYQRPQQMSNQDQFGQYYSHH